MTCGPDYWSSWQGDVIAGFSGNSVSNTAYGMYVETDETTPFLSTTVSVSGHATAGNTTDLALFGLGSFSLTGVSGATVDVGYPGSIQLGINLAQVGGQVTVGAGTFHERLTVNKALQLYGAQYGVDPTQSGARLSPAAETVVDLIGLGIANPNVLLEIPVGTTDVTVAGFTLNGSTVSHYADETTIRGWDDRLAVEDNIIDGYFGVLYKGNDHFALRRNRVTANMTGVVVQPNAATDVTMEGNRIAPGASPAVGNAGAYMTSVTGGTVRANDVSGFTNSNALGGSNLTSLLIEENQFTGCKKGVNIWGATTFVEIRENVITGHIAEGIGIKGQDLSIHNNTITGNATGIIIDKHTLTTERVTILGNDLSGNSTWALQVTPAVLDLVGASANWWGVNASSGVVGEISGTADYTPWLDTGTDTSGDPGFQGNFATLWVDDDSPQSGTTGRVQEGIDLVSGSTVQVAAGLYEEQLEIDEPLLSSGPAPVRR